MTMPSVAILVVSDCTRKKNNTNTELHYDLLQIELIIDVAPTQLKLDLPQIVHT